MDNFFSGRINQSRSEEEGEESATEPIRSSFLAPLQGRYLVNETLVSTGAFVWGLQAVCDLHRIPFTPALALRQFLPPCSLLSLQRATEAAGLKSGWRRVRLKELARLPTPFVATIVLSGQPARLADPPWGDREPWGDKGGGNCRLAVVLYCDGQRISFIEEGAREPVSSTLQEFSPRYRGEVLCLAPAASPLRDPDAAVYGQICGALG